MAYLVNLGCFGERVVEDEDEALEFVRAHYPDGVIGSWADVDDPAIGESPIYENDDESDDFAIGSVYSCNRNRDRLPLQDWDD
jgi:hypothetical protein